MAVIKVSAFVKAVPMAARGLLPEDLRQFKVAAMPWLSQSYYDDKLIHYELVKLPSRFGDNAWELGLHFESRLAERNRGLLTYFDRHLFEIRDALGDDWVAEIWDRGWTKIYVTFNYPVLTEDLVAPTAERLAQAIRTLEPLRRLVG
jgi:hypothetical protein